LLNPTHLRQTTCECVYFQLRDKDGGTIQSAIVKNPVLNANFTALFSIEPELLLTEVLGCGDREFHGI